jgi:hypothetical protein
LLLGVVAAVAVLAARLEVPAAILLVLTGVVLALVPGLPAVELSPEAVLLLVLPPVVYNAISEDGFSLKVAEHFYDTDVGGDSETRIEFEAIEGDERCQGNIEEWLDTARQIADGGIISCEDRSDYDS